MNHSIPTTINSIPQEVFYMILDNISYEERLECRYVSKQFMRVASYIFKKIKFTTREHVNFFAEAIKRNPSIASHVQTIEVKTAALLRAINQTDIKRACFNVKEVNILERQGNGLWAQHLAPYSNMQHPPMLMDAKNAQRVLDQHKDNMMTLRLGGDYLNNMTRSEVVQVINTTPNIRTLGLYYLYKEKGHDIHRHLPQTWTFDDLNFILNQPTNMHRFELSYCEVANTSLIGADPTNMELVAQLRELRLLSALSETSLLDVNPRLTHIEMKQVMVSNITQFLRSILDSYVNLELLDITFVERNRHFETVFEGQMYDVPRAWNRHLMHTSKLKKLALRSTQQRLNTQQFLQTLGRARAPIAEITIIDSNVTMREDTTLDVIFQNFANTIKSVTLNNKARCNMTRLGSLPLLENVSIHFHSAGFDIFDRLIKPHEVIRDCANLTELSLGYKDTANTISLHPWNFTNRPFTNITTITLEFVILNENEIKTLVLPCTNLKELVFIRCTFELGGGDPEESLTEQEGGLVSDLDKNETFDVVRSTDDVENRVRKDFFKGTDTTELAFLVAAQRRRTRLEGAPNFGVAAAASVIAANNNTSNRPLRAGRRQARGIDDSAQQLRRYNLHFRTLSLDHLGLHDCKMSKRGGVSSARIIHDFEVIQDKRSECSKTYNIDRAYHEKKTCNPYVRLNDQRESDITIGFNFTHVQGPAGKEDYRPLFKMRLFSLEKLSIKPNCMMSIYFTDIHGNRLKTCNTVVKQQIQAVKDVLEKPQQLQLAVPVVPPPPTTIIPPVEPARLVYNQRVLQLFNSEPSEDEQHFICDAKNQNQDVDRAIDVIQQAMEDAQMNNIMLIGNSDTQPPSLFHSDIFDSDIFKAVVRPCSRTSRASSSNRKIMAIVPSSGLAPQ